MGKLFDRLMEDLRMQEGLKACINCGTCTAICGAAEFYDYDPRKLVTQVQTRDDNVIEELLKSETIWYCGECMSCKTRCPRGNVPGLIVMALRYLSQQMGYFTHSEKGRQQLALKRTVGEWILTRGYCLYLEGVGTDLHPEQGPIWDWEQRNWQPVFDRLGANYQGSGGGVLRKIPDEALAEIHRIFEVTGGTAHFDKIESYSKQKAREMGIELPESGIDNAYFSTIYSQSEKSHTRLL